MRKPEIYQGIYKLGPAEEYQKVRTIVAAVTIKHARSRRHSGINQRDPDEPYIYGSQRVHN